MYYYIFLININFIRIFETIYNLEFWNHIILYDCSYNEEKETAILPKRCCTSNISLPSVVSTVFSTKSNMHLLLSCNPSQQEDSYLYELSMSVLEICLLLVCLSNKSCLGSTCSSRLSDSYISWRNAATWSRRAMRTRIASQIATFWFCSRYFGKSILGLIASCNPQC